MTVRKGSELISNDDDGTLLRTLGPDFLLTHKFEPGMPELEHVGIAVADVDAAIRIFRDILAEGPYKVESIEVDAVQTHFVRGGGAKLELLEATSPESPVSGFIEKRGPGLHHLAFEVEDLDDAVERLASRGYEPIDRRARPGADGKSIVFLHPKGTAGVLIELCESRRSVLREREISLDGRTIQIREGGHPDNPPFLMLGLSNFAEVIARRMEQSCRVVAVEPDLSAAEALAEDLISALDLQSFHMAAAGAFIGAALLTAASLRGRILSLTLIGGSIDRETVRPDCPILIAAPDDEESVQRALALRSRVGGSLAIWAADNLDLGALALERHVRNPGAPTFPIGKPFTTAPHR